MAKEEKKKSKASGGNGNTGAVMVVGAGIAGIQASLDLAKAGLYVHLVETKPAIGGIMAQLDKTFPTNDCSMCIISPKLVECGRHYEHRNPHLDGCQRDFRGAGEFFGKAGEAAPVCGHVQVHGLFGLHQGVSGGHAQRF